MTKKTPQPYLHLLSDLYFSEQLLVSALAKMSVAAASPALAGAFNDHQDETRDHERRLTGILSRLNDGAEPTRPEEISILPLVHDGEAVINHPLAPAAKDAELINVARRVERHEIAAYTEALNMARTMGDDAAAAELQLTLGEEINADAKLATLAQGDVPAPTGRVVSEVM